MPARNVTQAADEGQATPRAFGPTRRRRRGRPAPCIIGYRSADRSRAPQGRRVGRGSTCSRELAPPRGHAGPRGDRPLSHRQPQEAGPKGKSAVFGGLSRRRLPVGEREAGIRHPAFCSRFFGEVLVCCSCRQTGTARFTSAAPCSSTAFRSALPSPWQSRMLTIRCSGSGSVPVTAPALGRTRSRVYPPPGSTAHTQGCIRCQRPGTSPWTCPPPLASRKGVNK